MQAARIAIALAALSATQACATLPPSCRIVNRALDAEQQIAANSPLYLSCLADQGDRVAAVALGEIYERGDVVPRDDKRAAQLYRDAATAIPKRTAIYAPPVRLGGQGQILFVDNPNASAGEPLAMYRLGLMHIEGRGVSIDVRQGRALIERAARAGLPEAIAWLRSDANSPAP